MTTRIQHPVTLWEPAPSMYTHQVHLEYDPADPYALTLRFPSPAGRPGGGLTYHFARELLVDAAECFKTTGDDGQIRFTPHDDGWIGVELHPPLLFESNAGTRPDPDAEPLAQPDGYSLLLQAEAAAAFLKATYAAVPVSGESARIDWDAELAGVLGETR